jgi:tetratricopeptide (TPR) repeat protein
MKQLLFILVSLIPLFGLTQESTKIDSLNSHAKQLFDEADYKTALTIFQEIHDNLDPQDKTGLADCLFYKSMCAQFLGDYKQALDDANQSLELFSNLNDTSGIASINYRIGTIYLDQDIVSDEGTDFILKSLNLYKSINDPRGINKCHIVLGNVLLYQRKIEEALTYYMPSIEYYKSINDSMGIAIVYNNIGNAYSASEDKENALIYFDKSIAYYGKKFELNSAGTYNNIGQIHFENGNFQEAYKYAKKGYQLADSSGFALHIISSAQLLCLVYEQRNQGMEALKMHRIYTSMRDSVNNEEIQQATIRQQAQHEFEKEQIKKENEAKEQAKIAEEETNRRNNLQYSLIFLGILLLFGIVLSLGFIKVSANVAEGLIFFAFLILFEFVLVFVEPYLENYTNGEPMYNLLANSVIALLIFPLHDKLEDVLKKRIVKE